MHQRESIPLNAAIDLHSKVPLTSVEVPCADQWKYQVNK